MPSRIFQRSVGGVFGVTPRYRLIVGFGAVAALIGLWSAPPVTAAPQLVTSTADDGPGSLRQAIADAAPGDTITFDLPGCPCTITLADELVIDKDLTITGPGANSLTISGNNTVRVFFLNPGAPGALSGPPTDRPVVTITDVTIADGRGQGGTGGAGGGSGGGGAGMGGGIFVNGAHLTLARTVLADNAALGATSGIAGSGTFGTGGGGGGFAGAAVFDGGGSGGALGGTGFSTGLAGQGGHGGFGGGGGGGGAFSTGGGGGDGGTAGRFGGAGGDAVEPFNDGGGGGGAGLGGAVFVRAGDVLLDNVRFEGNRAIGGLGGLNKSEEHQGGNGQGKGGALFVCTVAEDASCGATVYASEVTFSANTAADDDGTTSDNDDVYGTTNPPPLHFLGFQPPLPKATVKSGSTLPVKFEVSTRVGASTDAEATHLRVTLTPGTTSTPCTYNADNATYRCNLRLPKQPGDYTLTVERQLDTGWSALPDGDSLSNNGNGLPIHLK